MSGASTTAVPADSLEAELSSVAATESASASASAPVPGSSREFGRTPSAARREHLEDLKVLRSQESMFDTVAVPRRRRRSSAGQLLDQLREPKKERPPHRWKLQELRGSN